MSEIPAERFGDSASAGLEAGVFSILDAYDINPIGEQSFKTKQDTTAWLRFKDGVLNDLTADISRADEPVLTIINLKSSAQGFVATEVIIPKRARNIKNHDDYAQLIKVASSTLLDYSQQARLLAVLDSFKGIYEEDIDRELEQILGQSFEEQSSKQPSLWKRKLKTAKFFGKTALMMFGAPSPYYAFLPVHPR